MATVGRQWRAKCIQEFGLQPVPDEWKDAVAAGSDEAWERYYAYRSQIENECANNNNDIHGYEDDGEDTFLDELKSSMQALQRDILGENKANRGVLWQYTPWLGELAWEDYDEIRTAHHNALVWSPFAIPHAVRLEHFFHSRPRMSTYEFSTSWSYCCWDFEDPTFRKSREFELCSNCFEDEVLRADVIETEHLNPGTVSKLRRFIFGSSTQAAVQGTMDDVPFLKLFFASMATFDFESEMKGGDYGYSWQPTDEVFQRMKAEGAINEAEVGGKWDISLSWLEHRIKEITNTLTRAETYYKHPTIEDAIGYDPYANEDDDDDDEDGYY